MGAATAAARTTTIVSTRAVSRRGSTRRCSSTHSSMHIRPALATDAGAIARLTTELGYPTSLDEIRTRLTALLPRDTQLIAVAENAAAVVGWVAAEERMTLESGRRVELVGLVVAASARRTGIGA